MISTRSDVLVIDTVVSLTLRKWETLSGQFGGNLREFVHRARLLIGANGLEAHKIRSFSEKQARVITGVAHTVDGQKLPLRRQEKIHQAELAFREAATDEEKLTMLRPLIGRLCEAAEIDPESWLSRATRRVREQREIRKRLAS